MPCNAVATVVGRLVISPALLFENAAAQTAHAALVDRLLAAAGLPVARHGVYSDQMYWVTQYGAITVYADGRVATRFVDRTRGLAAQAAVESYLRLLAQAKAKAGLAALGRITSEQRLANGAVVLSLEV